MKLTKQQTTNIARSPVFLAYFLQQVKANNKSVTLRLAPLAYNNAYKKFLEQRCNVFCLVLLSWWFRFLSQWASAWVPRSEKSFGAKLSNETSFKMDSILICTCLICTFYTLFMVNNLQRDSTLPYTHFSSMNKPDPEKIWTTIWIFWISLAPMKAYKTAKSILLSAHDWSFAKKTMQGVSSFNFCWFQQPIRSCGIVLTANQHCSQNLAAVSTNLWEFVSAPILALAIRENVWEPLKLGLISGYEIPNL